MNSASHRLFTSKFILLAFLFIDIAFLLLRFVNLNADFASGITKSGELYTDEGWYSASAVRHYLTGEWYLAGDLNTAVTEPGGQILYRLSFALFGLGLSSARIVVVISFLLLTIMLALWIRKYFGNSAALLSAMVFSTNFFAFAYSRLALRFLIALFFIIASFWVVESIKYGQELLKIFIASILMAYGILTYTSTLFAIPLLLFLAWMKGKNVKGRFLFIAITCMIIITMVGSYFLIMRNLYPSDFGISTPGMRNILFSSFSEWQRNLSIKIISCVKNLGPDFVTITFLLTLSAFVLSNKFRTNTLVVVLISYIGIYIIALSAIKYGPPRYYLMLLAPFTGLCAIASQTLSNWLSEHNFSKLAFIPILLVILVSMRGGYQIATYLANPKFSFIQMAHEVKSIIQEREGATKGVVLFGDIADSVVLEIGSPSINKALWTVTSIDDRLKRYHPNYLIDHTFNPDQVAISIGGKVTELGRWDVFDNYYANGEQVRLYYVVWPDK